MPPPDCALQVNVAAADVRHARQTLPHQLRQLGGQVSEVVYTVDRAAAAGRYAGSDGDAAATELDALLETVAASRPGVRTEDVDTRDSSRTLVAERFSGGVQLPVRDLHGAPFHAYLQGIADAGTPYVLHLDADVLLGGGSTGWVAEAIDALRADPTLIACCPLAGPPTVDGSIPEDVAAAQARAQLHGSRPQRVADRPPAYRLGHLTTRWFLIDVERLQAHVLHPIYGRRGPLRRPRRDRAAPLEVALSGHMRRHGLGRLDLLGSGTGMWALHPHPRTESFHRGLPELIERVERGEVPAAQQGHYELQRAFLDWGASPADGAPRASRWRRAGQLARRTPLGPLVEARARRRF